MRTNLERTKVITLRIEAMVPFPEDFARVQPKGYKKYVLNQLKLALHKQVDKSEVEHMQIKVLDL